MICLVIALSQTRQHAGAIVGLYLSSCRLSWLQEQHGGHHQVLDCHHQLARYSYIYATMRTKEVAANTSFAVSLFDFIRSYVGDF